MTVLVSQVRAKAGKRYGRQSCICGRDSKFCWRSPRDPRESGKTSCTPLKGPVHWTDHTSNTLVHQLRIVGAQKERSQRTLKHPGISTGQDYRVLWSTYEKRRERKKMISTWVIERDFISPEQTTSCSREYTKEWKQGNGKNIKPERKWSQFQKPYYFITILL